jgi:hypothetical protein
LQKYPVRATARANLEPAALAAHCKTHFERADPDGAAVTTSWGALAALKVWKDGKELAVEMTMNPKVEPAIASETIRRYNLFLQDVTGYSAKERASRLRKSAAKSPDGA